MRRNSIYHYNEIIVLVNRLNQEELIEKFLCKSKKFSMKHLPFVHWQCIIFIERLYNISIKFSIGGCHGNQT